MEEERVYRKPLVKTARIHRLAILLYTLYGILLCLLHYFLSAAALILVTPFLFLSAWLMVLPEDEKPVLSCSVLAARADGHAVHTLEGLQEEAADFAAFIAGQGAEQCGFCNPGFVMNTVALLRENPDPTDDEIRAYLAGNLCRCSGYEGQLRGIRAYLDHKRQG